MIKMVILANTRERRIQEEDDKEEGEGDEEVKGPKSVSRWRWIQVFFIAHQFLEEKKNKKKLTDKSTPLTHLLFNSR